MKQVIRGGSIVLEDRVVQGDLHLENGIISRIVTDRAADGVELEGADIEDARGCYVLPGLIDLHCDAIEKEVQPRPNTLFPLSMAFLEFERKLPHHGITSMYHSLSLGVGLSLRGTHLLTELVELIHAYRDKRAVVRNGIHLRYEVTHLDALPLVERYVREGLIDYLSFMDHSPGQGQYRKSGSFERYVMKNQGIDIQAVRTIVTELGERRQLVDWERLEKLGHMAAALGIAVASHDDDTPERAERSRRLGCTVSEFPITLETARYAARRGMYVCVGAPNVVRGISHDSNLRAADAIAAGAANILCSDYHPSSLLTSLFKLVDDRILSLPEAVRMATLYPAAVLGIEGRLGTIAEGKAADLIIVDRYEKHPWVTHAFVGGMLVYAGGVR
ncbi:alpha-D-ribose 1-methylphosphonate 5-triphosphate diphosphatase [Paenibacillus mendelii]|uniref:Alpha-D-ribose 1-methylphosphonate 5-triphosphate diphosphatase n=1 Tax=Paenibacillus mendelii TaxID=206163 RepID=A0ABV6JK21_9BACL|nr:alpha-D-ribose 1-methylphosphonate 5-triphosphate diphosphatase [Paenibacillus mendelii]MCQ6559190.1 alpha-D-ribose 1-methylphosphonate 5-triphosphate diphosphatase [Paenibacillus mendelii]